MPNKQTNSPIGLIILGAIFVLIPASFIALRLFTPSDGARISEGERLFTEKGAIVSPYDPGDPQWQAGDVVTAVAGVDMKTWAARLFVPGIQRPALEKGDRVEYKIERDGQIIEQTIELGPYPFRAVLVQYWGAMLFAFGSQVVAIFVLIKKPEDPAARVLFLWAMSASHTYAWSFFLQLSDFVGGTGFWLFNLATPGLWLVNWPAGLHLVLVFPRPVEIIRRRGWIVPALYLLSFGIFIIEVAWWWFIEKNILLWLNFRSTAENMVAGIFLAATMITLIGRFIFGLTDIERMQMRWVVFGGAITGTITLIFWIITPQVLGRTFLNPNLLGLVLLLFPISLAVAIVRHQLFDIDVIIRRTLVYSALTGILALIYFASVVIIGQLLQLLTGQVSSAGIVISTLMIAALFTPLRRRIQDIIDRRFFRRKYDAEKALDRFAGMARSETDLERLEAALLGVVNETLEPERSQLWLKNQTNAPAGELISTSKSVNRTPRQ